MKSVLKKIFYTLSLVPFFAVTISNPAGNLFVTVGDNSFKALLTFAIQGILLPLAGLVSMLFIIIGGFRYITARGDEEAAASGKKTLTNAVMGLVIVIISYIIVTVIINALKGRVN